MSEKAELHRIDFRSGVATFFCPELKKEVEISGQLDYDVVTYYDGTIRSLSIGFTCVCGHYHEAAVKN